MLMPFHCGLNLYKALIFIAHSPLNGPLSYFFLAEIFLKVYHTQNIRIRAFENALIWKQISNWPFEKKKASN